MVGIVSAQQGYRFCWMVNQHFDIEFIRDPEQHICVKKKETEFYFPVYQYNIPNSNYKYLLYKLKNGNETILPETKHLDYLWLIQTASPEEDAIEIARELKNIPDVQLVQILDDDMIGKSMLNLVV